MRLVALGSLVALFAAACGSAPPAHTTPVVPAAQPQPPAPAPAPPPPVAAQPSFPGAPATPAGDQLSWVLDALVRRQGKVTLDDVKAHFAPSFLATPGLPPVDVVFGQLARQFPNLTIESVDRESDFALAAHCTVGGEKLKISLSVDRSTTQITGLLFGPEMTIGPKPQSWDEVKSQLGALAPKTSLLVARLDKGVCKPLQKIANTDELAIGSAFKLYVLLALADQIEAGKAQWTDDLAVRDDTKSLPSGVTQDEAAGTKHSLQVWAERMISISDNTAADHLLRFVGRDAVEAELVSTHHAKPKIDRPFLMTREMFVLKLGTPPADLDAYFKMNAAAKRAYLDKTVAAESPDLTKADAWTTAHLIDKLEWFASPDDLCNAMAGVWKRGQDAKTAAILDVMSKNPGLPLDRTSWTYVGYKGGSEPGVLNLTYLLRRTDDTWFVVTASANTAEGGEVDEGKMVGLMTGVLDLTAATK